MEQPAGLYAAYGRGDLDACLRLFAPDCQVTFPGMRPQYSVLQASDGKEAWRLIREHHPAVAILDWQMPVYSGLELTDVIKGDPQMRGMTVIMLTGRSAQADREAGARAHADL